MNRTERRAYNKGYKSVRMANNSQVDGYVERYDRHVLKVPPSIFNFKGGDEEEPIVCSSFGCSRTLSITEQLFGSKCIHCQGINKIDAGRFISIP